MIDDSYLSSYKWCLMKFNGKFIMGGNGIGKMAFFKHFLFFLFSMCELAYSLKKEEWHASWFMRHFCLLRTFLRTLFSEIILKIDQEKKDVREIVTMTKSEVFFQLWQKKVILRTNFGLSFVIAMHRELPISNYRKCLILGLIVKVYEAMKIENCLNTFFLRYFARSW